MNDSARTAAPPELLDALIIGAGITGLYQLHVLKKQGRSVRILEAGDGIGGVWFWNRYPNARFDSESYSYGYLTEPELYRDWKWSEHFAAQPEIEAYLNHFVDRFDLRDDIALDTRVVAATFDSAARVWVVDTDDGRTYRARFLLTAIGILSDPLEPREPGLEDFQGVAVHTARWPKEPVDFAGKRVAVIGTGSSGVQVIPTIAAAADQLTVFQRSPNWCAPINNAPITAEEQAELDRLGAQGMIDLIAEAAGGFIHSPVRRSALDVDPQERREHFEKLYNSPGLVKMNGNYQDIGRNPEANALMSEFVADKIRERVTDPEIADKLIPKDHGYGSKRPPMETGYYEVFNQDNVELVDIKANPIERFEETGIRTADGLREFDVIVLAIGFDFVTGAFDKITITGTDGRTLKEHWSEGPVTHMGMMCTGFPNFLMIGGAHSAFGNMPRSTEILADTAAEIVAATLDAGHDIVETSPELEAEWTDKVLGDAEGRLIAETANYFTGANVPGKPRRWLVYTGSTIADFRNHLAQSGGEGFSRLSFA